MDEVIQSMDRYYRDQHGIDPIGQRVIYRRPNYEWECVAPLIVFRARFKRMDK